MVSQCPFVTFHSSWFNEYPFYSFVKLVVLTSLIFQYTDKICAELVDWYGNNLKDTTIFHICNAMELFWQKNGVPKYV